MANEKDGKIWGDLYETVYLPYQMFVTARVDLDKERVLKVIRSIYEKEAIDMKWPDLRKWKEGDKKPKCNSCHEGFDEVRISPFF